MLDALVEGIAGYYLRHSGSLNRSERGSRLEELKNRLFVDAVDSRLGRFLLHRWVLEGYVRPISRDPSNENILQRLKKFSGLVHALVPDITDRKYETFTMDSVIRAFEDAADGKEVNLANTVRRTIGLLGEKGLDTLIFRYGGDIMIASIKEHSRGQRNPIREAAVEVHTACNAIPRCLGCYAKDDGGELDEKTLTQLLKDLKEEGSRFTFVVGGEPLLRKQMLLRLFARFREMPFLVSTNGKLVDEAYAKAVAELGNVGTFINTPGLEQTALLLRRDPNVWNDIMRAFDNLRKQGAVAGFATTVYQSNFEEVSSPQFIEQMMRSGAVLGFYLPYQTPLGCHPVEGGHMTGEMQARFSKRIQDLLNTYPIVLLDTSIGGKSIKCPASIGNFIYAKADGSVGPCPWKTLSSDSLNIRNRPLHDILQEPVFNRLRASDGKCVGASYELTNMLLKHAKEKVNVS
ncbi:radical SAM protein [Candidatus Woesearchaeota archaeon]|nr:radical SAM protein [Candidatus Woesearchaeota archaeon]